MNYQRYYFWMIGLLLLMSLSAWVPTVVAAVPDVSGRPSGTEPGGRR